MSEDNNILTLYSYNDNSCILLNIEKEDNTIIITSFGMYNKCFRMCINIGSNLLRITLKVIKQYKDK